MSDASISIVIPTWNHLSLLKDCLNSLYAQTRSPNEIIVVDDGSTEDVQGPLSREFPHVRVVRLPSNRGFCAAVNAGIRESPSQYVFLLNNDMTLDPMCLENLMQRSSASPDAVLTPLVLFQDAQDTIYSAGDRLLRNGRPESIGFRLSRAVFWLPHTIFGVTGGAALIPSAVFDRIGLFDESFVAYFEDADFCARARLAGFECAVVPEAIAYHVGSASLAGRTWWRSRQCFRNHGLLIVKNFPLSVAIRFLPEIVHERLHQAKMLIASARTEFGLARALGIFLIAVGSFLLALPSALAARMRIQRGKTISAATFASLLSAPGQQQ